MKKVAGRTYAERAYWALLFAYPPAFRHRYSEEMAQMFAACCREARSQGRGEFARLWLLTVADLFASAMREWTQACAHPRTLAPLRLVLTVVVVGLLAELASLRLLFASFPACKRNFIIT